MNRIIFVLLAIIAFPVSSRSDDWPMYRADAARSGYTSERLPERLSLRWTYRAAHQPQPAWPTRNRLGFDRAYQPVVAKGLLYFGSSADGKVHALDTASGQTRWSFFTEAPIRFAPAIWRDRVFVVSDDGHLYCLAAEDGRLLWKRRGGRGADMLLGNDRMISRWPARGGPVIIDDTVYFATGIWPSEGVSIFAVAPDTGRVIWCNDSSGSLEMDQPHKTARAKSGVAAQGYLAASADTLLVPTGRAVPAAFARSDGKLRYFHLQQYQQLGGADVVVTDALFFNAGAVYSVDGGVTLGGLGFPVAAHPQFVVGAEKGSIIAWDRKNLLVDREVVDRRGNKTKVKKLSSPVWTVWTVSVPFHAEPEVSEPAETTTPDNVMGSTAWSRPHLTGTADALIIADSKVVAGGRDKVTVVDIESRETVWSADVHGIARGLAVSNGCLYVSTDQGLIYCFDGAATQNPLTVQPSRRDPEHAPNSTYAVAAEEILRRTGITEGYCLDLACGDGRLSLELARRTKLQIYAVEQDPVKVQAARQMFDEAGLYGVRVTVHCSDLASLSYPNHFADLVVSGRSVVDGPDVVPTSSWDRMRCPHRGVACLGRVGEMTIAVRDPLPGAGEWTHQNGNLGNTLCSDDTVVRGPLEMLWFRDTDLVMPNRHGRAPGPLVRQGIMFVEGLNQLRAQNIYNGRTLWEYSLPGIVQTYHREHSIGAAWTGGNYCVSGDRVYLHDGERCVCLDARSGRKMAEFEPPQHPHGKRGTWGYIACDGDLLFGSLVNEDYLVKSWSERWDMSGQFTESTLLFALEAHTGKLKWTFAPESSIRHNSLAIGGGQVYLIDRALAPFDDIRLTESDARTEAKRRAVASGNSEEEEFQRMTAHRPGRLVALDAKTGQPCWRAKHDTFGTLLVHSAKHDVLLAAYQAVHQASRDSERGDRLAAFRASDGKRLWEVGAEYVDRPVICDRTVYAPPGAWDLLTGRRLPFSLERSYGCGIVVGSERLLVYRSATLGYLDLDGAQRTENYGGIRPGCWIAAIPAGGLVLMQDAASWCTCSYLNQATIALQPSTERGQ